MFHHDVAVHAPEYEALKLLGSGVQANVILVKPKKSPGPLKALKMPVNHLASKTVAREVEILKQLPHLHVLACQSEDEKVSWGLFEYCENGNLLEKLLAVKRFPEPVARYFFLQLLGALDFIHTSGFVHRDIKLDNLMLNSSFELKLIDFGFATELLKDSKDPRERFSVGDTPKKSMEVLGTEGYQPPEMLKANQAYDPRHHDYFAAGVCLFALVLGSFPFEEATKSNKHYKHLARCHFDNFWKIFSKVKVSEEFKDFIQSLMAMDTRKRLSSCLAIKAHPWCLGEIARPEEVSSFLRKP